MSALAAIAALGLLIAALWQWPVPRVVARLWRRRSQRRAVRAELPILVDGIGAALASGLSLPQAFAEVAPTLGPELARCTRVVGSSLSLGARVEDALVAYEDAIPADDIAPFAVVLAAFSRSGGRVTPSLDRVATLLRGRLALEEERAALTAQSRASAAVLVALAPLGALFFSVAMPDYSATLVHEGLGLLVLATVFEAAGIVWLWRIVRSTEPPADLAIFLEAVVVGLDAGLTFERSLAAFVARAPAFRRAADARRLLADLALGIPMARALRAFAAGRDEARVAALVAASARFGSPLARLLVVQADTLRATERHRAQATARRLPILMLFPLALCILPALLLVFLGPPLLTLLR
ncbi:MAG: type II secretion system F family protein [Chloroflexota bacterium]